MAQEGADVASAYRDFYHAKFQEDVSAGTKKPFLVPLYFLSYWFIPIVYLAIPHKNRSWLYRARWLVLAFTVAFNFHMILNVSSHNFASAYGAGLIGAWGIIWNFTLLVWTKPQWEARRVEIRRKRSRKNGHIVQTTKSSKGGADSADSTGLESDRCKPNGNGSAHNRKERKDGAAIPKTSPEQTELSEESRKLLLDAIPSLRKYQNDDEIVAELKKLEAEQEFEYYWQEYPADASLWTRLDWAFDIASSFRMTGKQASCISLLRKD